MNRSLTTICFDGVLRQFRGRGVVVAVSGGADSVGLLRILGEVREVFGLQLSVAHLHHGVRGDAAGADADFVADLANSLGLPFDLGHWSPSRAAHFEADARQARYAWLVEVANRRGAACVAVGHTQDDQAETILHRILRGTGPRGLTGMPVRRELAENITLVRPLLGISRQEIRRYLETLGQPFREDASNADTSRTRARIRHDLLPKLAADYNPHVVEAIVRLGALAEESETALDRLLGRVERRAIASDGDEEVLLRRSVLARMSSALRVRLLRRIWRGKQWSEQGMTRDHWRELAERAVHGAQGWTGAGGSLRVEGDFSALRHGPTLRMRRAGTPDPVPLAVPGSVDFLGVRITATLDPIENIVERVDLDRLKLPLSVAVFDHAARFDPLGMGGLHQTVGEFLRGRRVPRLDRGRVPIVRDQTGIVWVVGHRIAERVRRTEATIRTLGLGWELDR